VDQARSRWYAETAVTRDKAHLSGTELRARGIDPDAADDRVTADEWIDAHRAEQAERERDQEIAADYEVTAQDDQEVAEQNDEITDVAAADIRDSTPQRDERADSDGVGRIPTVDEAATEVAQAQLALREIETRRDQERRAESEAQRTEEIAHWEVDDRGQQVDASQDEPAAGDEEVREI
jgi:hypothetical protein